MDLKVSSHLLIRRDGESVQYVPFHRRAWHAGASSYQRPRTLQRFLDRHRAGRRATRLPYEPAQYRVLSAAILALCARLSVAVAERIAGHSDIAPGPQDRSRARRSTGRGCTRYCGRLPDSGDTFRARTRLV